MKKNPFKFGSVVTGPFFTNRKEEISRAVSVISSENHLVIISPRRFGKTSLIYKVLEESGRPNIILDLQLVTNREDFATQLLKKMYHVYPFERLKQLVKKFRIIPILSLNPLSNEVDISFQPGESGNVILEDVLNLLNEISSSRNKLVIVLDEFQEIKNISKDLDKQLRSILQFHKKINYVFLGSQESLMREIFEKKKSPFYHFGYLMTLDKIPEEEFKKYLQSGFNMKGETGKNLSEEIIEVTKCHPYYTQQLAFSVWEIIKNGGIGVNPLASAVNEIIDVHDMDYERLWGTINITNKKVLIGMAVSSIPPLSSEFSKKFFTTATSTIFSALKKLMLTGMVIKTIHGYEIDDPFFKRWIQRRRGM